MHTFHIYCSFADKPLILTRLALLAVPAREKYNSLRGSLLRIASKITFFSTQETEVHVI